MTIKKVLKEENYKTKEIILKSQKPSIGKKLKECYQQGSPKWLKRRQIIVKEISYPQLETDKKRE